MSDLTKEEQESKDRERRDRQVSARIAGWILFIAALVVAAIVLGPCDPAPEPIPAGPQATTTGLHEVVPATPGESSSSSGSSMSTTGETSTTGGL